MAGGSPTTLVQVAFRARGDTVGLNVDTWDHTLNDNFSQEVDTPFRVRFVIAETTGGMANNVAYSLQYDVGAGFVAIGDTAVVRSAASSQFDHLDATEQRISSGSFVPGVGVTQTTTTNISLQNNRTEIEWCLSLDSAQLDNDDTVVLRVVQNSGTVLNAYTETPTITVIKVAVPGAPTGLTATTADHETIDLAWTAPGDDGGSAITGYRIERESPIGNGFSILVSDTGTTGTTYQDTGLEPDTQYNYRVSAISAAGVGPASDPDDATTDETVAWAVVSWAEGEGVAAVTGDTTPVEITASLAGTSTLSRMAGKLLFPAPAGFVDTRCDAGKGIDCTTGSTVATTKGAAKSVPVSATVTAAFIAALQYLLFMVASLTGSATITRAVSTAILASADGAVAVTRSIGALIGVSASTAVSVARGAAKMVVAAVDGLASLSRDTSKALGITALASALIRWEAGVAVAVTAAVAGSVAVSRSVGKALAATAAGTVALARDVVKAIVASATGGVSDTLGAAKAVAASVSASVATAAQKVFLVFVTPLLSATASVSRSVDKGITAAATGLVDLARQLTLSKAISASVSGAASFTRNTGKAISATALGTVAIDASKAFIVAIQAALAGTVSISRSAGKVVALSVQAIADITAEFIAGVGEVFNQAITASLTASVTVSRSVAKVLTAALDATVDATKACAKAVATACSGAANVVKAISKALAASFIADAVVNATRVFLVFVAAALNGAATVTRSAGKGIAAAASGLAQQAPRAIGKGVTAVTAGTVATGKAMTATLSASLAALVSVRKSATAVIVAAANTATTIGALFISAADAIIRRIPLLARKIVATFTGRQAGWQPTGTVQDIQISGSSSQPEITGRKPSTDIKGGV